MVQMTKSEIQSQINRLFVNNTSGDIEADEVNALLTDINDSVTFLTPIDPPSIRSFVISNQPTSVDPGTEISGTKSFVYIVANSDDVTGTLTLTQDATTLSTTIDPKGDAANIAVTTITLAATQATVFTLSGVDVNTNPFSATFTITARDVDEYVYYGTQVSSDASTFDFANESRIPFVSGDQTITIPTFTDNEHLIIAQKATEPDFTSILIDGVDQINAFLKTPNAFVVNAANYSAWTSKNALIGSIVSGDRITLVR